MCRYRQAFFKAHGAQAALCELLLQGLGHGFQAQAAQFAKRLMHHHGWCVRVGFHW